MTPERQQDQRPADRAFARFCANGDPDDLAEVFDLTAPRLILVAMHLTRDLATAEDLLQTTFLEAIASAARCDPRRPVLPWLLTILTRRASNERRRRGREVTQNCGGLIGASGPGGSTGSIEAAGARAAPDPAGVAEGRETYEKVVTAIESLPKPYREVLALRFVHELTPVQISRALDRPIGTVHAQLHRGTERLRAVLPKSLLGILALLCCRERGLAAVRDSVIGSLAAAVAGSLALKKLACAAAVLLSLLAAWMLHTDSVSGSPGDVGSGTPTPLRSEASEGSQPGSDRLALGRTGIPQRPGSPGDPEIPRSVFSGRVVAAESGTPIAGATVRVKIYGTVLPEDWRDPVPVVTGPDGRYRAVFSPPRYLQVELWVEHPDRVPARWTNWDVARGFDIDQGDVRLHRAATTRIRVVDEEGRPVQGFHVRLSAQRPSRGRNVPGPYAYTTAHTDTDGRIPAQRLYPATWNLRPDDGFDGVVEHGSSFVVAPGEFQKDVTIRLALPPAERSISGRVVDEQGRPVEGLLLDAKQGEMAGYRQARSVQDGSFRFGHFDPRGDAVRFLGPPHRLLFDDYDRKWREIIAPLEPVPIGTTDVTVVVRSIEAVPMRIRVVDPEGKPVERFAWSCAPVLHVRDDTRLLYDLRLSREIDHRGGIARRGDLLPGSYILVVEPEDSRLARRFGQRFEVPASGRCEVRVQLDRPVSWKVVVRDPRGVPVEGVRVVLLQGFTATRLGRYTLSVDALLRRGVYGTYPSLRVADSITDDTGAVQFETAPSFDAAAIRVTGDGVVSQLVRVATPPAAENPLEITVHRGAVLEGVIGPAATVRAWGATARQREDCAALADREERMAESMPQVSAVEISPVARPRRLAGIAVGEDGTFRYPSVPPGSWRLVLSYDHGRYDLTLGEVVGLRAGETRQVRYSIRELTPGSLRGIALLDGQRIGRGRLRMSTFKADIHRGTFEFLRLLPRRYWPELEVENRRRLFLGRAVEVQSGQHLEPTFFFVRRRLVLRIVDRNGEPLRGRPVSLRIREPAALNDWAVWRPEQTDADGRVVFDPAPPFSVDVRVCHRDAVGSKWWLPEVVNDRSTRLGPVSAGGAANATTEGVIELVVRE
jgi:RNA polymerase sigma factor (sigma-70 family)